MIRILTCISVLLLFLSCSKLAPQPDPADTFVGEYVFDETRYVVGTGIPDSFLNQNSFTLTKIAPDKVKMTGAWKTVGTIIGDTISFEDCMFSNANGYVVYTFSIGTLGGKALSFNYLAKGSLKSNSLVLSLEQSGKIFANKISD